MPDNSKEANSGKELYERPSDKKYRPADFMRARHPELFSDSSETDEPSLTREVFEYHLDSLTSRKEEIVFEHFCRRLAEKELCPNLSPQTGPTGGGDSKCDAETYPVADQIALRWYHGEATHTGTERWAFAFSAKQEWRSKVRSDVKGIADTGRDYVLIYFVTSRPARDKVRAALEDELTRKHGITVRILDRSWIVKCVFDNDRLQLAVETLNLDETSVNARKTVGPRDVRNKERLRQIEDRISDTSRYAGAEYQLAEDCLRAALIARGLELPRVEVDGRFERADRVATQVGHPQQQLRIAYNRGWTAYWWFEDLNEFSRFYGQVELLAVNSEQANDLELLANLWTVLHTATASGQLDEAAGDLPQRTTTLVSALEKLASDNSRPNNSLWARTQLLLMKMSSAANKPDDIPAVLQDFIRTLQTAEGLIAYPFEPISRIVEELGQWLGDSADYDELLEQVVAVTRKRVGEREAGRMLLARGFQKLRAGKTYDAIRFFGRAQQKLALRESREELAEALFGCGLAYESAGLFWAARANALSAANQVLSDYWEDGFIAPQASTCARRLVWLELQLGRVACAMEWMGLASALAHARGLDESEKARFSDQRAAQDGTLGILLLKSEMGDLTRLRFLPDVLDETGLYLSRMALLYALGYEQLLRDEGTIPPTESSEDVRQFFTEWLKQPAANDLPDSAVGLDGGVMTLTSHVLGCTLNVHAEDDDESSLLAERILAAAEALLATSLELDVLPHREEFTVKVERSIRIQGLPQCEFDEDYGIATVRHCGIITNAPDRPHTWFLDTVLQIVGRIIWPRDTEQYANRVFGEEAGLARAVNFTDSATPIRNILGRAPRFRLSDWNNEGSPKAFVTRRETPWHEGLLKVQQDDTEAGPLLGVGAPPRDLLDRSGTKHTDRRVLSLINMALWNKAKWNGTLYMWTARPDDEPLLALAFANSDGGQAIFREWIDKLGKTDEEDRLRISILTGIDVSNPFAYKVVVSSNLKIHGNGSKGKEIVLLSRFHRMDAQDPKNLETFQDRYKRVGSYYILPAYLADVNSKPQVFYELAIHKHSIQIRPAWQVGENDPDSAAIGTEDTAIIPPEVTDAPILRVLERKRQQGRASGAAGLESPK